MTVEVLSITHLTGASTYVRIGGVSDGGTQPGLYSLNLEEEYSDSSHGVGTEYCGRVVYVTLYPITISCISSGIGQHDTLYTSQNINSDCYVSGTIDPRYAKCSYNGTPSIALLVGVIACSILSFSPAVILAHIIHRLSQLETTL